MARKSIRRQRRKATAYAAAVGALIVGLFVVLLVVKPSSFSRLPLRSVAVSATPLRLDGGYGPRFAGEILAQERGRLGEHSVVLEAVPRGDNFVQNVVRDRAIGVTTGQRFLLAAWQGQPIVAFAASFLDTPLAIVTLQKSGYRYPGDLVGKRVSYEANSEQGVIFEALVAQLGLPRSQISNIDVTDRLGALRRGQVDAIMADIDDPRLWSDESDARLNLIRPQDYGIHVPGQVYFASAQLVRDRPSLIVETLKAAIAGWREVYDDIDRTVPAIVTFDPKRLKPNIVRKILQQQRDLVLPTGARIGEFDQSRWNTLRDVLLFARLGEETVGLPSVITYDITRDVYRRPFGSAPEAGAPVN